MQNFTFLNFFCSISISSMNCNICGVTTSGKIRCRSSVCEACKRFFVRHQNMEVNLECEKGDNQCLSGNQVQMRISEKGYIWRNLCAACRFQKCIDMGMNYSGRKNCSLSLPSINNATSASTSTATVNKAFQQQQQQQQQQPPLFANDDKMKSSSHQNLNLNHHQLDCIPSQTELIALILACQSLPNFC